LLGTVKLYINMRGINLGVMLGPRSSAQIQDLR